MVAHALKLAHSFPISVGDSPKCTQIQWKGITMKQENNINFFFSLSLVRFVRQKPFLDEFFYTVVAFTFAKFSTTRWHISACNDFIESKEKVLSSICLIVKKNNITHTHHQTSNKWTNKRTNEENENRMKIQCHDILSRQVILIEHSGVCERSGAKTRDCFLLSLQ